MAPSWTDVVGKGVRPHPTPGSPSSTPLDRILAVYRACAAKGLWVRVQLESREGEEEISFCCRNPTAAPSSGSVPNIRQKRPGNERRREKEIRRREAWITRRKDAPTTHLSAVGAFSPTAEIVSSAAAEQAAAKGAAGGTAASGASASGAAASGAAASGAAASGAAASGAAA
jgi:hypothetical protein